MVSACVVQLLTSNSCSVWSRVRKIATHHARPRTSLSVCWLSTPPAYCCCSSTASAPALACPCRTPAPIRPHLLLLLLPTCRQLPAVGDHDVEGGLAAAAAARLHGLHHLEALQHLPSDEEWRVAAMAQLS